jgi:hypothetical protein
MQMDFPFARNRAPVVQERVGCAQFQDDVISLQVVEVRLSFQKPSGIDKVLQQNDEEVILRKHFDLCVVQK